MAGWPERARSHVREQPVSEIEFRLLGPLDVRLSGVGVPINGARPQTILAMLLLEAGQVVPLSRLIDAIWEDNPPATARTQVQICVSELRRTFDRHGSPQLIVTRPPGYLIQVPPATVDVARFRQLVQQGRRVANSDPRAAVGHLRDALSLWRGEALAGLDSRLVQAAVLRLREERLAALEECLALELELGRHHELVGELRALVAEYPLREKLYAHLMLALYRGGRHAEALAVYRTAYRILVEEHGIDPGEELQALERAILDQDPSLELPDPAPAAARAEPAPPAPVVPSQLPAPVPDFVGRADLVEAIGQRLRISDPNRVEVLVVCGPGGSGKTALTLHVAHQVRAQFPGGQLYAHLRGGDARPVRPEQVLDQFLRALGVPPSALPSETEALAAMYRDRTAGRRLLVVLDDAKSADQVLPLIPGDPGCAVLVTSRTPLTGLSGARRFEVSTLDPDTSVQLLAEVIGPERVAREPEAAAELAVCCGHLPLALRIAAAKLAVRPHWYLSQMVRRLRGERQRLDELTLDGAGVRASLTMSYQMLSPTAARLLLLLSLLGSTDFGGWVVWPLLDCSPDAQADPLDELVDARLVEVQLGSGQQTRYRLHDLTRIFALELLAVEIPQSERLAAQQRLLSCWLFLVSHAHRREYGGDFTVLHSQAPHWPLPDDLLDDLLDDPIEWLHSERDNLVAAVGLAARLGLTELCWDLAVTSTTLFEARSHRQAWRHTHELALEAVRQAGDTRGEAVLRYSRGGLALMEKRLDEAREDLEAALAWFDAAGDQHGYGLAAGDLALIARLQGQPAQARQRCEVAVAALQAAGDLVGEAYVLRTYAQVQHDLGRLAEAESLLHEAAAICARASSRRVEAQIRHALGELFLEQERLVDAEREFTAVLEIVQGTDDPGGKAYALLGLGSVALARGDLDRAGTELAAALVEARRAGNRLGQGRILLATAHWAAASGDTSAADTALAQAVGLFQEVGAPSWLERARQLRAQLAARPQPATVGGTGD